MNTAQQFEIHPDAESLNGFAEDALPAAERTEVMAHLAACERCREVVFLAQNAAAAQEPRMVAAAAALVDSRRPAMPWWRRWRVALIPAAALAILAWVAILMHSNRSALPSVEMAKMGPAPEPVTEPAAETPQAKMLQAEKAVPKAQANVTIQRPALARSAARIAPGVTATNGLVSAPAALQVEADQLARTGGAANANKPRQGEGHSVAGGYFRSRPRAKGQAQNPIVSGALDNAAQGAKMQGSSKKPEPSAAPASAASAAPALPARTAATQTVAVSAEAVPIQTEAQTVNAQIEGVVPAMKARARENKALGLPTLPSGLPVVSIVAAGRTTLALDAMGSLFLSREPGGEWKRVKSQWKGRAMVVRLAQPVGSEAAQVEVGSAKNFDASIAPFELVTDSNAVWTSADGKKWRAK